MKQLYTRKLLFPLLLFWTVNLSGLPYFEFSPLAKQAYEKALSLRFIEAKTLIAKMKMQEPDNYMVYHIENYLDFFRLYINENIVEYNYLKKNKTRRLDKIKQADPESPYFLYIQADILLQWALVRLKFDEYLTAFSEVGRAHKLLKKNKGKFPGFLPNQKNLGILHAMVGTIPDGYKWGVKILSGLEGTIEQGKREIEYVLEQARKRDFIYETETVVLYSFLLLHLDNNGKKAWQIIKNSKLQPEKNPLHCFIVSNIAMRTEQNDIAIQNLQNCPRGRAFLHIPYIDYMLGVAKLRRLDSDTKSHFQQYLLKFKGRNFIKETYQKLAWSELVADNPTGYKKYMKACTEKGEAITGGDKNALKEAQKKKIPNVKLVKARLLFDGGYFQRAYQILSNESISSFSNKQNQIEYIYRLGRILHGMKRWSKAIDYYQQTIDIGQQEKYFFACNAALQIGLIHEAQGNIKKARQFFHTCLKIKPDEYKTGLHQKAKAGLSRLKRIKT